MPNSAEVLIIPVGATTGGMKQLADPSRHKEDDNRWLDIKEYSIFLNDGVLRSFGLVPCPILARSDAPAVSLVSTLTDQVKNSTTKMAELQERVLKLCSLSPTQIRHYHKYQYNLFKSMWLWKYKNATKPAGLPETSKARQIRQTPTTELQPGLMGSTISLLLLVPLLKSQATMDKQLAVDTAKLLLSMLLELPCMSLSLEFQTPLNELESLFGEWILEHGETFQEIGMSVMVGLCCARGSLSSVIKTIRLLHGQPNKNAKIPMKNVVLNLPNVEFRLGKPCRISGCHHLCAWQYDDQFTPAPGTEPMTFVEPDGTQAGENHNWHGLAVDGTYLFVTGIHGHGLAKIGTGFNGSLQGFLYNRNNDIHVEFLAYGNGILVTKSIDIATSDYNVPFGNVIDTETLTFGPIIMESEVKLEGSFLLVGFTSDGYYFYVITAQYDKPGPFDLEAGVTPLQIFLSIYDITKTEDGTYMARLKCPHIPLEREVDLEPVNETDDSRKPKLSYLAAAVSPSPAPTVPDRSSSEVKTSLGISFEDLLSASFISNGNYLTIFVDEYSAGPRTPNTSPLLQSINRHFAAGATNALHNPKATGTQIHICLHNMTPTYSKNSLGTLPALCSFQRGLNTLNQTGFAFDAVNNLIWTASGDFADAWKNTGNVPPWKEREQLILSNTEIPENGTSEIEVHQVLELLWTHVALQAYHSQNSSLQDATGKTATDDKNLVNIWGILNQLDPKTLNSSELTAFLVILQSTILRSKIPLPVSEISALEEIQSLALSFFSDSDLVQKFRCDTPKSTVYAEASKLLVLTFELTCTTTTQRQYLASKLFKLMESMDSSVANILKTNILSHLTKNLKEDGTLFEKGQLWIVPLWIIRKLIGEDSVQNTLDVFDSNEAYNKNHPVAVPLISHATAYITALVNCLLKSWTLGHILNIKEDPNFAALAVQIFKAVLNHCSTILDRAIEFVMADPEVSLSRLISTENILKSSLVGMAVPQIYIWLCEHSSNKVCDSVHPPGQPCPVIEEVAEECVQLYVAISHLADRMTPIDQSEESKDYERFRIEEFSPFQNSRLFESLHPLKENTKIRESILFTGAKRLYVKFDPRCATQYDYDKFVLCSGTGPNAKRVAEYGGNFYGFGNRSGFPSYWSRDLVKVDGDTVSYTLDMQSGKEHQTPPEALWGFSFAVFPIYDTYTLPGVTINVPSRTQVTKQGLVIREQFFIDKLSLAAVDCMSCILAKLMNGEPSTTLELELPALFSNKLFSRNYPWFKMMFCLRVKWTSPKHLPPKETLLDGISSAKVAQLRHISNSGTLPLMGKKLRDVVKPEELEKLYVLACLKCLTKPDDDNDQTDCIISPLELNPNDILCNPCATPDVLHEMFQHLDSYIRKFVSIAEIQFEVRAEIEQVLCGSKSLEDVYGILNVESNLETFALIFELNFNKDNMDSTAADLRSIVEAFVTEGTCPLLTKLEELMDETVLKLRHLIIGEMVQSEGQFGAVRDSKELVNEVHKFVFSHVLNQKASMTGILEVSSIHNLRSMSRCQGLQLLLKLLECSKHTAHSVLMASHVIQQSQRIENISCSSLIPEVQALTARGITAVVEQAKPNPFMHRYAIALLCAIPYKRESEKTLASSGLLELLDELCGMRVQELSSCKGSDLTSESSTNILNSETNSTSLAWAAFQILAHHCSSWEASENFRDELELMDSAHLELPIKISRNVTNHLTRVTMTSPLQNEICEMSPVRSGPPLSEGTADVLALLDTLRFTNLGRDILKQSSCICKLLQILLDARQPPFIVLTIIRLLSTGLPLVENLDVSDLNQLNIPLTKKKGSQGVKDPNPYSIVVSLLLSKLADFLVVCGNPKILNPVDQQSGNDSQPENVPATTLPHRSPAPVPIITIGQQGLNTAAKAKLVLSEKKCLEKNLYLQSHDAPRNFLSGEVAAELAVEVRKLIQQLQAGTDFNVSEKSSGNLQSASSGRLTLTSESMERLANRKKLWSMAVEHALVSALKPLAKLTGISNPLSIPLESYAHSARIAIATLSVLGSIDERIKIGSEVWILAADALMENGNSEQTEFIPTRVRVISVCERSGVAIVQYVNGKNEHRNIAPARTLRVPISRLSVSKFPNSPPPLEIRTTILQELATNFKNLLLPIPGNSSSRHVDVSCPLKKPIPNMEQILSTGSASPTCAPTTASESRLVAQRMTVVRLIAEIRTRAAQILSIWLKNPEFLELFLGIRSEEGVEGQVIAPDASIVVNSLNDIGNECKPSSRLRSVEGQVTRLRLWYRDCTKPARLASPTEDVTGPSSISVPVARIDAVQATTGTSSDSGIRFRRISDSLQELSLGPLFPYLANIDSDSDLSFTMTDSEESDNEPESEYASPMSSRNFLQRDEINEGINELFLELGENGSDSTVNLDDADDENETNFLPLLADEEPINDPGLSVAHAQPSSTTTASVPSSASAGASGGHIRPKEKMNRCASHKPQPQIAKPKAENKEYSPSDVLECYLSPSSTYDIRVFSGPNPYICPCSAKFEPDSDLLSLKDESLDAETSQVPLFRPTDFDIVEDVHQLLLKAWEARVFPFIRRRFRNESERRDGLEQIRNALTLGMIDIARQTVEFLYEENGGVPRDLHLPTLEEIKVEAARFTLERIKVGMHVLIHQVKKTSEIQETQKYAVNSMLKTFGLIGEVLEIDETHELILVESYVESDGILHRFWYPIKALERLDGEKKPPPNSRTVSMLKLHANLMELESSLTQLYCRKAYLAILNFGLHDANGEFSVDNRPSSIPSTSISSLFEDVDLGNLQIRSQDSFADFPLNADLLTCNLGVAAPSLDFLTEMGNPSVAFFREKDKLTAELKRTITNVYNRGGDESLIMLTSRVCSILDVTSDKFLWHEVSLEKEASFDISLPNMAFSLVSVQGPLPKKSSPPPIVLNRDPCVHVFATNSGDLKTCPLICYPVQTLGALLKATTSAFGSIHPGPGIQDRKLTAFPTVLVPTDRIKCVIQQGCLPGHKLQVLGIPSAFPLALLYCQELINFLQGLGSMREAGVNLLSIFLSFLEKYSLPPLVKEWIFNLCSGILSIQSTSPLVQNFCQGKSDLINRLFTEVIVLYERETKIQTPLTQNVNFPFSFFGFTTSNGARGARRSTSRQRRNRPQITAPNQAQPLTNLRAANPIEELEAEKKVNDTHNFPLVSSYFQALLELCLNLSDGRELTYTPATLSPAASTEPTPTATPARMSSNTGIAVLLEENTVRNSAFQPAQRNKNFRALKPGPASSKTNSWKRVGKSFNSETKSPASGSAPPLTKLDELNLKTSTEMKWFRQASYALELLKTFSGNEFSRRSPTLGSKVVQHCLNEMKPSTSQARLFVIYGAPKNIPDMPVETSVTRALNQTGGIYANELWLSEDRTELVVEIRSSARAEEAYAALQKNLAWYPVENFIVYPAVSVFCVNNSLDTGNRRADTILAEYLGQKIFDHENPENLSEKATETFSGIFTSCYVFNDNEGQFESSDLDDTGVLLLTKKHMLNDAGDANLMKKFVATLKPANFELEYFVQEILKKFGQRKNSTPKSACSENSKAAAPNLTETKKLLKESGKKADKEAVIIPNGSEDGLGLSESGFLQWCTQLAKDNLCSLWRALLETGHDLRLDKCWVPDASNLVQMMTEVGWTKQQDAALVTYVNCLVSKLRISPQTIHPHEIYLEESLFLNPAFKPLQGIPIESVRTRFAILQVINEAVHYNLLPFVSLNFGNNQKTSISALLHDARHMFFYNTKEEFLYKVFLNSAHRGHEIPPPEVTLDPIRNIGAPILESMQTMFSCAICQLSQVPSQTFCVIPATGGDPPLAMVIKFSGEEVQGIIGSFRHFLSRAILEFQEPAIGFLIPCPSASAGKNKDSLILRPGPLTYGEGRFLQCLGQFIGICLRADVPVPITLIAATWRSLLNVSKELNEVNDDLKEADILTASFLEAFEMEGVNESSFERILESQDVATFKYVSMDGTTMVSLCPGGSNLNLRFANKDQFVRLVKKLRQKELASSSRVAMILAGLATILPLPFFFNVFTSSDLRSRVAGAPEINLALLKAHTHYQMGLSESDRHIQFFWTALESMTPEELRHFVKFATNQDRLPTNCPCENSQRLTLAVHVPPFPMKLSPIDIPQGASETYINKRTIRAETCLFLVRLPPYTTYQVTREQLLYACNSRDDPLSG